MDCCLLFSLLLTDLDEDEWNMYGYYKHPIGIGEEGCRSDYIQRIHVRDTNREDFQKNYESTRTPCMIEGICEQWPAWTEWTIENIRRKYGDTKMKCGEDDDGRSIRLRVWKYLEYIKHQQDDSPVYLFEGAFDEDRKCKQLLQEYVSDSNFPTRATQRPPITVCVGRVPVLQVHTARHFPAVLI